MIRADNKPGRTTTFLWSKVVCVDHFFERQKSSLEHLPKGSRQRRRTTMSMKKSASEDALNTFIKEDSSLGADGALVFNNVGKWFLTSFSH